MAELADYNGYTGKERDDKFEVMKRKIANGDIPPPSGSCELCGDSGVELEYHDEDYSQPYSWARPAAYMLCKHCHIQKIHGRFRHPNHWKAFLAHVRRGGHASDLYGPIANPELKREFDACCEAIKAGRTHELSPLRAYQHEIGREWFANLSLDQEVMEDRSSRPRP